MILQHFVKQDLPNPSSLAGFMDVEVQYAQSCDLEVLTSVLKKLWIVYFQGMLVLKSQHVQRQQTARSQDRAPYTQS